MQEVVDKGGMIILSQDYMRTICGGRGLEAKNSLHEILTSSRSRDEKTKAVRSLLMVPEKVAKEIVMGLESTHTICTK